MRFTLLAIGSRGDVQPFVALGSRLVERGHHVRIAAAVDYRGLVETHGLEFHPIVGSIQEFIDPRVATAFQGRFGNPIRMLRHFFKVVEPLLEQMLNDCWEASRAAEALIVSTLGRYCGDPIAQSLDIPMHVCHFHPNAATATQPHMLLPALPLRLPGAKQYHRASYTLTELMFWLSFQRPLNRLRQQLGLPSESALTSLRRHQAQPPNTLHAYSRHLAPPPADWNAAADSLTGFWLLPHQPWEPPQALSHFLATGEAPLLFTFGSMMLGPAAIHIRAWIIEAVQRLGIRALLFRGWNELEVQTSSILTIDSTPHQWLLPRTSGVVHHGGAGITAAALHAQTRALIIPFLGDQYFWGQRLSALGAAPKPLPRKQLNQPKLVAALEHLLTTPRYQERTVALGRLIATEDGISNAIERIETGGLACCQSASQD